VCKEWSWCRAVSFALRAEKPDGVGRKDQRGACVPHYQQLVRLGSRGSYRAN